MSRRDKSEAKSAGSSLLELVVIVAVALGMALGIQAFLVKPYRIPSESMVPTLEIGQRVLVNRIGTHFGDPSVGDILVFHPPSGAESGTGDQCGEQPKPGAACDKPTGEQGERQLHQARRRRPRRHDRRPQRARDPQRQADQGAVHQLHLCR